MSEIKNLKKAANRIKKAIKNKEKIILYGDADLDGTASVVILKEAIKNLGGETSAIYFVNREKEGYGINEIALNFLKKKAPALLIALDLGITNFEEVKIAKKLGFEVIIIDHHQIVDYLPEASIIVDPKQPDDKYPFKELANVGIVYRLIRILFSNKLTKVLDNSFLELTALATIADMMPQIEENKVYIEKGLESLKETWRPGLKVFNDIELQKIISALNVSQLSDHLTEAYLLLTSKDEKEAKKLAEKLLERHQQRRSQIKEITEQIETKISANPGPIIFEGQSEYLNIFIGSIASRICNKYKKPTFIFKKRKDKCIGAVRVPKGMDSVKAMKSCAKLLITFGGHAPASGFSIKNENLEKFKQCLIKYFSKI